MTALFDSHCHLYAEQFKQDLKEVILRAQEHSVKHIMVPAENILSSQSTINLCASYKNVRLYAAVGIHPEYAGEEISRVGELNELVASKQVLAVGEIGLDYYWMNSEKDIQQQVFVKCLELARNVEKPVIIHNRESTADMLAILHDWTEGIPTDSRLKCYTGVLHAFNGDQDILEFARTSGFYIGVGGPVTFKNARQLQATIPHIPLNKLLIETDSPYLAPHPRRGERNEPAHVRFVAQKIADILENDVEAIVKITTRNALELFNIQGV